MVVKQKGSRKNLDKRAKNLIMTGTSIIVISVLFGMRNEECCCSVLNGDLHRNPVPYF